MASTFKAQGKLALSLELCLAAIQPVHQLSARHVIQICTSGLDPFILAQFLKEITPDIEFRFMPHNKVCKIRFLVQNVRGVVSVLLRQCLPVVPRPYAGREMKGSVSKLHRVGTDGVVNQIEIRDIIFPGIHNADLRLFAVLVNVF